MTPIQQLMLGVGAKKKTYMDDVFSTYVYEGNSTARSINNGLDLSGKGGMTWIKSRNNAYDHYIVDTERGALNRIRSNSSGGSGSAAGTLTAFNNNGFSLGSDSTNLVVNASNKTYSSWSFRRASGFFDVVTYTGTGSARTIAHSLGSVPGMILIKRLDTADNWNVYHRSQHSSNSAGYYLQLNTNDAIGGASNRWNDTAPTATEFTVGTAPVVNANGDDFVAYVFAGGESTAATARSVDFDGTGDKLSIASHADLQIGSSTYTMEFWVYKNADTPDNYDVWAAKGSNNNNTREFAIESMTDQTMAWYYATSGGSWSVINDVSAGTIPTGQWVHICAQKDSSGYFSFFVNGTRTYYSTTGGATLNTGGDAFCIGGFDDANTALESNIKISNFRFIKGTALYSSSFRPSTEPLANVTNTKLLCCNDSSITGSTVTPSTISSVGSPTASTDSPFDDPAGFVFGEGGDKQAIKCGSYVGNGSATGPEINLGWEPQWVLIKSSSASVSWHMFDSMRGIPTGASDARLEADENGSEFSNSNATYNYLDLTPTGFKIKTSGGWVNTSGDTYIYMVIRRPDGYCGKPRTATELFAMDAGNSSTTESFTSGFPVDFGLYKGITSSGDFYATARLIGSNQLKTNTTDAEGATTVKWDNNTGFQGWSGFTSDYQSWMWKRHAGFDVVTYKGDGASSRQIPHSLSKIPEMMWVKGRGPDVANWYVYHKAMGNGRSINLETTDQQSGVSQARWNNTTPTSTHFSIGINPNTNNNDYLAILFSSVDGISKVGSFSGVASASYPLSVTTGFAPRFILIKAYSGVSGYGWFVWDSLRYSGDDNLKLALNSTAAQDSGTTYQYFNDAPISTNSTGFSLVSDGWGSTDGTEFMYYAHA